jgi:hypothetical protein
MPRLHINFSGPQLGWLGIKIQAEGGEICVNASYTPHDTLTEFAEALVQILELGSSRPIPINEEPQESVLQFDREGDYLLITHTCVGRSSGESPKVLKAPFRSATREIARKLRFLYDEVGYDGFVKHWRHRPPKDQIARAWNQFAQQATAANRSAASSLNSTPSVRDSEG